MARIYLDHAAATPVRPEVLEAMLPYFTVRFTITYLNFPVEADVTKPPLIAWAAWKLYEYGNDSEFLDEIYEAIRPATIGG